MTNDLEKETSATLTPRNLKALENRNRIVEAAKRLVNERGYDNVTVNDIVAECGLTKGAFYYHFKSKNEVVFQLDRSRFTNVIDEIESSGLTDPLEKMVSYIRKWHSYMDEDTRHYSQDWLRQNLNPEQRHAAYGNTSAFGIDLDYIRNYLEQAVESGYLKPETPVDDLAKMVAYCMYGSFCERCLSDDSPPTSAWAERATNYLIEIGLAPFYAPGYHYPS